MSKEYSFKSYIQKHQYNHLYHAVGNFIKKNRSEIELWSNLIDVDSLTGNDLALEDIEIKYVYVNGDTHKNQITYDVVLAAEISFCEHNNRYGDSEDSCVVWFRISCQVTLDGKQSKFQIEVVEPYDKKKSRFKRQLSDALVPIISKKSLDAEAAMFLDQYCPQALEFPRAINPFHIAEKMGLKVVPKEITEDCSIFGQIYFHDTIVNEEIVKSGTIFVDPRVTERRNFGVLNNTVMHECVNWHKHRLAFELVRLYEPALSNISITVEEVDGITSAKLTATDWMEWHARALAPKILLPNAMFKRTVEYFEREYHLKHNGKKASVEQLINQVAEEFGVSKLSAKIRMVECGFEQAIGAYNWVDGRVCAVSQLEARDFRSYADIFY